MYLRLSVCVTLKTEYVHCKLLSLILKVGTFNRKQRLIDYLRKLQIYKLNIILTFKFKTFKTASNTIEKQLHIK